MFALVFLLAFQSSAWAQIQLLDGPLLTGATSFTISTITSTVVKQTPCYIKDFNIPECRRRRGIEEQPEIQFLRSQIAPSAVATVEATPAPRAIINEPRFDSQTVFSSLDDSYFGTMNVFRQLANKGRNNIITVGDCGRSTVNFSQFLSCLGMTVQETTYLTATFTETTTLSSGYATFLIVGCIPTKFPYISCQEYETPTDFTTFNPAFNATEISVAFETTTTGTPQQFETTTGNTSQFETTTLGTTPELPPSPGFEVDPTVTTPAPPFSVIAGGRSSSVFRNSKL